MSGARFITNLGDVNPLSYGGYFIYEDAPDSRASRIKAQDWSPKPRKNAMYSAELLVPVDDAPYLVYRFRLDRLKLVNGYLVPLKYEPSWPRPLEHYDEWFSNDIPRMAESVDWSAEELREAFTSEDPVKLALAYEILGGYHGFENLDSDPLSLTQEQVEKRYKEELRRP
jgi:hypothetical protein